MSIRINWSKDGTKAYTIQTNNSISELNSTNKDLLDGDPAWTGGEVGAGWGNEGTRLAFNFPQPITIDKIQLMHTCDGGNTHVMDVSSNSTNGVDGSWVTVESGSIGSGLYVQTFNITTPTEARWFRIRVYGGSAGSYFRWQRWCMFGEYSNPYIEYWDATESALITDNYEVFDTATKESDYTFFKSFKIKNVHPDLQTHSYSLLIDPLWYGGDSFITNYWSLSDKGAATVPGDKVTTLALTDIPYNGFSAEIRVYGDFTIAQNPANGYHYWYVRTTETA